VGDFHQGVLGILASRICHEYNRPTIIFTRTEEGTYKGSGRSVPGVNIHSVLCSMGDMFLRFGGHKMAIGLEILPDKFNEFKKAFNNSIDIDSINEARKSDYNYDIEITEDDISLKFINQLKLLEPFGCANEKPIFMMRANALICEQMKGKNYKHYRLHTKYGKQIIAFNAYKNIELLKSNCKKNLIVDLELNEFNGKKYANCKLKEVEYADTSFSFNSKHVVASSIVNKYLSFNSKKSKGCTHLSESNLIKKIIELSANEYGTLIVCQNNKHLEKLLSNEIIKNKFVVSSVAPSNKRNCILIRSAGLQEPILGYSNYVFLRSALKNEHNMFSDEFAVFDSSVYGQVDLIEKDRTVMGLCYNLIKKNTNNIYSNDIFEWADKISAYDKRISSAQVLFAAFVFKSLGLLEISGLNDTIVSLTKDEKVNLTDSKFYNEF